MHDAKDIFLLMNPHDQGLMLDDRFEIRKQSALQDKERVPDAQQRTVTVSKLTERL
jgi:hypothetical protein